MCSLKDCATFLFKLAGYFLVLRGINQVAPEYMHIVIIGNGIAGITAARFIRKLSDHRITIVSKESDYFFSRTALMYIYMGHMRFQDTQPYEHWFWEKNRIDLVRGEVSELDFDQKIVKLTGKRFDDSKLSAPPDHIPYDKLLIACGSASNKFGWPGQDLKYVQGLYSIQDVESMEARTAGLGRAVIVGGGLIGIEMAEMFHSREIPVTMLVREENYWDIVLPKEESIMVGRHILEHKIDLRLKTELKEIKGNDRGEAIAVITNHGEEIKCGLVGLTAGVHPNVHWLKGTDLEIEKGILVNAQLQTNLPDVYAAGDCAQMRDPNPGRRPIEAVWYVGRMMGETVAHNICGGQIPYDPGIWFNSAKFMDLEYQVYGTVPTKLGDNQESLYWEEENGKKSVRIVFDASSGAVLGFNLMGVRFRHEVCEQWIRDATPLEDVLVQLPLANFDPEFYDPIHESVIQSYNDQEGKSLKLARKRKYNQVFSFLKSKA